MSHTNHRRKNRAPRHLENKSRRFGHNDARGDAHRRAGWKNGTMRVDRSAGHLAEKELALGVPVLTEPRASMSRGRQGHQTTTRLEVEGRPRSRGGGGHFRVVEGNRKHRKWKGKRAYHKALNASRAPPAKEHTDAE